MPEVSISGKPLYMAMKYSERYGYEKVRDAIQLDTLDASTRNLLWNIIGPFIKLLDQHCAVSSAIYQLCYEMNIDTVPFANVRDATGRTRFSQVDHYTWIANKFREDLAYKCFDLIEFVLDNQGDWVAAYNEWEIEDSAMVVPIRQDEFNTVFERKCVGCRCVDGKVVQITSELELSEIELALYGKSDAVTEQLRRALQLFSNREKPDYLNAMKESISAVESYCKILTKKEDATLGDALKFMRNRGLVIHPTLDHAFNVLFSYASDENGIRHGGVEHGRVDSALAKFFLVSCAAFINYLKVTVPIDRELA